MNLVPLQVAIDTICASSDDASAQSDWQFFCSSSEAAERVRFPLADEMIVDGEPLRVALVVVVIDREIGGTRQRARRLRVVEGQRCLH